MPRSSTLHAQGQFNPRRAGQGWVAGNVGPSATYSLGSSAVVLRNPDSRRALALAVSTAPKTATPGSKTLAVVGTVHDGGERNSMAVWIDQQPWVFDPKPSRESEGGAVVVLPDGSVVAIGNEGRRNGEVRVVRFGPNQTAAPAWSILCAHGSNRVNRILDATASPSGGVVVMAGVTAVDEKARRQGWLLAVDAMAGKCLYSRSYAEFADTVVFERIHRTNDGFHVTGAWGDDNRKDVLVASLDSGARPVWARRCGGERNEHFISSVSGSDGIHVVSRSGLYDATAIEAAWALTLDQNGFVVRESLLRVPGGEVNDGLSYDGTVLRTVSSGKMTFTYGLSMAIKHGVAWKFDGSFLGSGSAGIANKRALTCLDLLASGEVSSLVRDRRR